MDQTGESKYFFFHAQTVIRRKRNKIHGLNLPNGEWCIDPIRLKEEALQFFQDLFCSSGGMMGDGHDILNNILSNEDRLHLVKLITKEEVHNALMSMKSYKAPGPDGFQPIFFKMF